LDFFEMHCRERPEADFLGTRTKSLVDGKLTYGEYEWMSFAKTQEVTQSLARGLHHMGLANDCEGDGKSWKFVGIWARNRWEWMATYMANMHFNYTSVGFFDSMGG
jgi:long-subunit acyl-CoA synthetase (AMP-forming)